MTVLSLDITTAFLSNVAIHPSSHNWPIESNDEAIELKTCALLAAGETRLWEAERVGPRMCVVMCVCVGDGVHGPVRRADHQRTEQVPQEVLNIRTGQPARRVG